MRGKKYRDRDRGDAADIVRNDAQRQAANVIVEEDAVGNVTAIGADAELHFIAAVLDGIIQRRCNAACAGRIDRAGVAVIGSEEHTSELQSQSNLVCRLLLEKKNKDKSSISDAL